MTPRSRPSRWAGSARAVAGDVPEGTAEMMTEETDKAIQSGLGLAGPQPERRRLLRQRHLPRQHRRHQPGRPGVHVLRLQPRPRALRRPDRQGPGLRHGQHLALGLHLGVGVVDARADVLARLRHAVPRRGLRHDPSARDPREAPEGRAAHHRHPEQRGGLAVPADQARRRPLGHHLPDQCACGRPGTRGCTCPRTRSTPASST